MIIQRKFIRNYLTKAHYVSGVPAAVIVLAFCFIASLFYWDNSSLFSPHLSANLNLVKGKGEFWRLFTTTFVHADLKHLLSNSLMLYILTYFVTSFFGIFLSIGVSFVVAMLVNYITLSHYGGEVTLVGASGVVYYLWGFWMILYLLLQRHMSLIARVLRMGSIFLILLIPTEFQPTTSYLAHYVGLLLGLIVGLVYFLFNKEKLFKAEIWEEKIIDDSLTPLDEIALSYPKE